MNIDALEPSSPIVLIADDEKLMRLQLRRALEQEGYRVIEAVDGADCLTLYAQHQPDIVLLDALMPVMNGFDCCATLQTLMDDASTPVLIITGLDDKTAVDQAFAAGATDYVMKPIHWPVLLQRVRRLLQQVQLKQQQAKLYAKLEAANQALQQLATIDSLTKVANRRRFDEYLEQEWRRATRDQLPVSLILGDIDFFKLYNDTYGHPAGDACLRQVAQTIQSTAKRTTDLVARYGGEEFAVILPNTDSAGAVQVAETICSKVRALKIAHTRSGVSPYVTLSLGVTTMVPGYASEPSLLIAAADQALYQAKEAGRNRATHSVMGTSSPTSPSPQFQILIIDDDPLSRLVLRKALQDQGYTVILAQNGEEGIAQVHQRRPALVICDWEMPGISGLDVCRQIKSDPSLSATFFILLTGRISVEDRVEGLDTGADDFLPKPIEINELKARVRAGLRLCRANQELQKLAQDLQTQKHIQESELAEAATYLRSLLPVPMTGSVTINSRFLPSRQLGGDCFDYYWLDPDYLMIYLLDVSGHGLKAALPSVSIQNLLRTQSLPDTNLYQPSSVLKALNDIFQMDDQDSQYFTMWYGVYNRKKRQLFYASAGHPAAILLSKTEASTPSIKRLKTRGCAIGLFPDAKYVSERCDIDESSTLYIFSDGIFEIEQSNGATWGLEHFVKVLMDYHATEPCSLDALLQNVKEVNRCDTFQDDCSVLQIKFSNL